MNEPWPGSASATCFNTAGCPDFDTGQLATMSRAGDRGDPRRRRAPDHLQRAQRPVQLRRRHQPARPRRRSGILVSRLLPDRGGRERAGRLRGADDLVFDNADTLRGAHRRLPDPLRVRGDRRHPDARADRPYADDHMVSWQEWHYCGCDDPTTQGPGDVQALVKDPARRRRATTSSATSSGAGASLPAGDRRDPGAVLVRSRHRAFELAYTLDRADGSGSSAAARR